MRGLWASQMCLCFVHGHICPNCKLYLYKLQMYLYKLQMYLYKLKMYLFKLHIIFVQLRGLWASQMCLCFVHGHICTNYKLYLSKLQMYLCNLQNVFVQIANNFVQLHGVCASQMCLCSFHGHCFTFGCNRGSNEGGSNSKRTPYFLKGVVVLVVQYDRLELILSKLL